MNGRLKKLKQQRVRVNTAAACVVHGAQRAQQRCVVVERWRPASAAWPVATLSHVLADSQENDVRLPISTRAHCACCTSCNGTGQQQ
jgi:hypothetical protein